MVYLFVPGRSGQLLFFASVKFCSDNPFLAPDRIIPVFVNISNKTVG